MPGELKAVLISQTEVFVGSRLRRTRELFALDCKFTLLDGSMTYIMRIHKDNPAIRFLRLKNVYRFIPAGGVGFKEQGALVTDTSSGHFYHMEKV